MKTRHQRPGPARISMLTADDASVLHAQKSGAEQSAVETLTELADLHVAVKQAEPIPSHTKSAL